MTDLLSQQTTTQEQDVDEQDVEAQQVDAEDLETGESGWGSIPDDPEADEVVVRRNGRVSIVIAGVSALISAAYFARAATTGGVLDWTLCIGLAILTWAHVFSFLDSRMPLLVADSHGVRIRLGRTWRGMAWSDLEEIEHLPRRGLLRDGRLVLFPRQLDSELSLLGPAGQRHARLTDRLHGAPFAMPLGLTTRVIGPRRDVTAALAALADGRCEVVEVVPATGGDEAEDAERPVADLSDYFEDTDDADGSEDTAEHDAVDLDDLTDPDGEEIEDTDEIAPAAYAASPTPSALRDVRPAVRAELSRERALDLDATQPHDLSAAIPAIPSATSTFVIGDLADLPVVEPVIGPELAAARERLRLSVDQLADRTRIRPHVIEAIEIDDFAPCGGDFYARGHLRTLARVLGVDVTPLLASYDDKYADAPIDPRRVFEAELATGRHGPIRGTRGGLNWSVVIAAVMVLVLAWSIARLVMDSPGTVNPSSPSLADGSAGLTSGGKVAEPVPVVISAAGGGARVVVRDGSGKVVFTGSLAFGQSRTLQVSPPVRVQSTDGSLEVSVDGQDHGALGKTGQPAQDVFTVR
jgi:transcriptional regulator with XRE-family HTH domain